MQMHLGIARDLLRLQPLPEFFISGRNFIGL